MRKVIDKINIAHILGILHFGGKEMVTVNVVNHVDSEIFNNHLITLAKGGSMKKMIDPQRCKLIEIGRKWGNDASLPFKIARVCRQHEIDIMHTTAWGTLLEGFFGARLGKVPAFIHVEHGTIKADSFKHKLVQRFVWNRSEHILSISHIHRQSLARAIGFDVEKIGVVENGVDLEKFKLESNGRDFKSLVGLPPETPVFGSVGRIVHVKNYPLLLRAAKKVFQQMPEARLLMIGAGPMYTDLRQLAKELDIEDNVIFMRWRKNVLDYLRAMDIFVLSSFSEGMSISILEAMASSLPVIATDVGGNPELVLDGETGLLVPSDNDEEMAAAILTLLRDPEKRKRFAAAGRKRVEENYTLQLMIRRYEQLYINAARKYRTFSPELEEKIRARNQAFDANMTRKLREFDERNALEPMYS
ncbi:MAG TPA: glycosyltransferase [Bacteroidetes bacterium]|nr:glycosyltransferase [Bacteroidota bacterium]